MNNKPPLGLPEGTIRAILALMILGATLAYWLIYKTMPTELLGVAGIVVGYYFGAREGTATGELKGYIAGANGSLCSTPAATTSVSSINVVADCPNLPEETTGETLE